MLQRSDTTRTSSTSAGHPDYYMTFEMMEIIIVARRPRVFLLEQVLGFLLTDPGEVQSHLDKFCTMLRKYYSGVRAVQLDAALWVDELSRGRCFVIGIEEDMGGEGSGAAVNGVLTDVVTDGSKARLKSCGRLALTRRVNSPMVDVCSADLRFSDFLALTSCIFADNAMRCHSVRWARKC